MKDAEQAHADTVATLTSCRFCEWTHTGTALEGREAARQHREDHHPEACIRKPRRTKRISRKSIRSAGEEEQILVDAAAAREARHERELGDMLAKVERARARVDAEEAAA